MSVLAKLCFFVAAITFLYAAYSFATLNDWPGRDKKIPQDWGWSWFWTAACVVAMLLGFVFLNARSNHVERKKVEVTESEVIQYLESLPEGPGLKYDVPEDAEDENGEPIIWAGEDGYNVKVRVPIKTRTPDPCKYKLYVMFVYVNRDGTMSLGNSREIPVDQEAKPANCQ